MEKNKKRRRTKTEVGSVSVPFRPKKLSFQYDRDDRVLLFRQNRIGQAKAAGGCFLTLWLIGWTVGCVLLIAGTLAGNWLMLLFGIPFWATWFFVFGTLMNMYFGRDRIQLDAEGLNYQYRVFVTVTHNKVPLDEIRHFQVRHGRRSSDDTDPNEFSVEAVTFGKSVCFSEVLLEEAEWMAHELNAMLTQLKGTEPQEKPDFDNESVEEKSDDLDAVPLLIPMNSAPEDVEKPSDCKRQAVSEFDSISFIHRGRFSFSVFGGATFVCLFWNGIVSIFVLHLWGFLPNEEPMGNGEWWVLFFFLIPFEVIGLIIFLAWLAAVFAPFYCEKWTISRATAKYRCSWFGIGKTRNYDLEDCRSMQIDNDSKKSLADTPNMLPPDAQEMWKIVFLDSQSNEICSIQGLTLGEAHWMADRILKYR